MRIFILATLCVWLGVPACAQRHNIEVAAAGVFPVGRYQTGVYSPGPGWHISYELRLSKRLGAEAGFTEGWLVGTDTCNRFGCAYSRQTLKLLDYGLRGVVPLASGKF